MDPTPKQRREHNCNHLPYRPWCSVCVEARGQEDPHYKEVKGEAEEDGMPTIAMDYATIGEREEADDTRRMMVGRHKWTKMTFCHKCQCKGNGGPRITKRVAKSIDDMG